MRRSALLLLATVVFMSTATVALASSLIGSDEDDVLRGTAQPDQIYAEGGDDRVFGGGGGDYL
nr:hypothetical protein [Thermoleophilaceae bacterium]